MRSKWLIVLFAFLLVALPLSAQSGAGQEAQPVEVVQEPPPTEVAPAEEAAPAKEPAEEVPAEPEPEPTPTEEEIVSTTSKAVSSYAMRTQALELPFMVGAGSYFADESTTFSGDALFISAMWHGFHPPGVPGALDVTAGTRVEIGTSNVQFDDVNVRVYSSNRARLVNLITGVDMKILDSGGWNFDTLIVGGYVLSKNVEFELYFLEEERPIAWAVHYRF
jgi:hypothetical protein